jgi:hypothetical protein
VPEASVLDGCLPCADTVTGFVHYSLKFDLLQTRLPKPLIFVGAAQKVFWAGPIFLRGNILATDARILSSWKDIANYTGKGVRTVQRWEHELGLPVRRPVNGVGKSMVMLNTSDMDAWMETRLCIGAPRKPEAPSETHLGTTHGTLKQNLQTIRELRNVTLALADQLESTARVLSAQHDPSTMLTIEVSWSVNVSRPQDSPLLPGLIRPGEK